MPEKGATMPFPSTDLADLASQFFKSDGGSDLSDAGPASRQLRDNVTHSEERTRPFVASVFWQAFLFTPSFAFFLRELERDHPGARVRLLQVVPHKRSNSWITRFDLLALMDGLSDPDLYVATDAKPLDEELTDGSQHFLTALRSSNGGHFDALHGIEHALLALEALHAQTFSILAFTAPSMARTASIVRPPTQILEPFSGVTSTAGVHCIDGNGKHGVTAAWHAVRDAINGAVQVGGIPGHVLSHDVMSDSTFVEVALAGAAAPIEAKPLMNLVPREHEPVTFVGLASPSGAGKVTGWSPQLPTVTGNAQLVVTTDPISMPGDSGAALLDGQGTLLGFCHESSQFGAINPYSSWIWAESVFRAHGLS